MLLKTQEALLKLWDNLGLRPAEGKGFLFTVLTAEEGALMRFLLDILN